MISVRNSSDDMSPLEVLTGSTNLIITAYAYANGQKMMAIPEWNMIAIIFWPFAYAYAVLIKSVLPVKTSKGLMSSEEFLTDMIPDFKWFRIWGCKCYVLEPRVEHRKDFQRRYRNLNNPIGMMVYVSELSGITISTNVVCDQVIPKPDEEYRQALRGTSPEIRYTPAADTKAKTDKPHRDEVRIKPTHDA
jgi:hypothetical protein